jgi:hypothetical protein
MEHAPLIALVCDVLLAGFCVRRYSMRRGFVEVNHIALFTLGFLLYWILPIATASLGLLRDEVWMSTWYGLFDAIPAGRLTAYVVTCGCAYASFVAGSAAAGALAWRPAEPMRWRFDQRVVMILFVPLLLAAIGFAVLVRHELFHGYATIYEEFGFRGSFTAASLFLLSLALVDLARRHDATPTLRSMRGILINRYLFTYFVFAVLVLSMGGRLYFISSLLMIVAYRTVFVRPARTSLLAGTFVALAVVSGAIGLFRSGSAAAPGAVATNLLAEFFFTSLSLTHFLGNHALPLLRAPIFLASDFSNLVPLVIFPQKASFLIQPDAYGFEVFAPFGALNSFFSFMINFGVLGTFVVLFALGFGLTRLKHQEGSVVSRVVYVMLSGWLTFTFFRDPFSVSIVKNMFEFSIVVPVLLVVAMRCLTLAGSVDIARSEPFHRPAA